MFGLHDNIFKRPIFQYGLLKVSQISESKIILSTRIIFSCKFITFKSLVTEEASQFPLGMTFRAVSKEATKLTVSFSKPPAPSVDVS